MFKLRESLATDDELRRQNIILRVLFRNVEPITLLEKKAAAIVRHPRIDPLLVSKTAKILPDVLQLLQRESDLLEPEFRNRILEMLNATEWSPEDGVLVPCKQQVYVSPVTLNSQHDSDVSIHLPLAEISRVSLVDFEEFAFNSKTLYKYYENTSFASYLFQNLIYSQNLMANKELNVLHDRTDLNWQTRLASLLYLTNVNESVAANAFYQDTVVYDKLEYDTSFVPKYDVRSIQPLTEIVPSATEQEMINYYYSFDPSETKLVPKQYLSIFLSFPFKSGYYVHPNGSITFANLPRLNRYSLVNTFVRICDISDIEAAIENVARRVTMEDALSYAAYAKTLTAQGVALMVLKRVIGRNDTLYLPTISTYLRLNDELNMLAWMNFSCKRGRVLLPVAYRTPTGDQSLSLVRDIARSCASKLGAAILCSTYYLPELDINHVHANLQNDAERYVLYTLVLQQYSNAMFHAARNALRPIFGQSDKVDLSRYDVSSRNYVTAIPRKDYRAIMFGADARAPLNCVSERCMDDFEFTDPQLNALTRDDEVPLTDQQTAAYIASVISSTAAR